jgi:hypothetical protein
MSSEREKNELKSQGAVEAAQNPDSSVTGDDATRVILDESKKAGSAALEFNPDASPEEKAAQARSVRFGENAVKPCTTDNAIAAECYRSSTKRRRNSH